jgi:hypothetical protein
VTERDERGCPVPQQNADGDWSIDTPLGRLWLPSEDDE